MTHQKTDTNATVSKPNPRPKQTWNDHAGHPFEIVDWHPHGYRLGGKFELRYAVGSGVLTTMVTDDYVGQNCTFVSGPTEVLHVPELAADGITATRDASVVMATLARRSWEKPDERALVVCATQRVAFAREFATAVRNDGHELADLTQEHDDGRRIRWAVAAGRDGGMVFFFSAVTAARDATLTDIPVPLSSFATIYIADGVPPNVVATVRSWSAA